MTTPLVPEPPQLPELSGHSPAAPATPRPGRRFEPAARSVLLPLLALILVLAVLVGAVPVEPPVTVALLLLVSVGVLAVGFREDEDPLLATALEGPGDEVPETLGVYYYDRHGRPVPIDEAF